MFVFIWLGQVLAMALGNLHSFLQHDLSPLPHHPTMKIHWRL